MCKICADKYFNRPKQFTEVGIIEGFVIGAAECRDIELIIQGF